MRLAFSLSGRRSAAEAVALAREVERLGMDEIWVTEDYVERGAFALAGALAAVTDRARIGIGVVNPWTRHPMVTAMETAALAEISGDRVMLGLGVSNARWMEHQLGIPFEKPVARLEEALVLLRRALSGEPVDHDGVHFRVHAAVGFRAGAPAVPLVVGAKGRCALSVVAGHADGVLLSILSSPPYVAWVRQLLGAQATLSAYVSVFLDDDRAAARQAAKPMVARFLGVHGVHDITRVAGLDARRCAAFRAGWVSGEERVDLVDQAMLDTFVAAGDEGDVAGYLDALKRAGLDVAVLRDEPGTDVTAMVSRVQQLRQRVHT